MPPALLRPTGRAVTSSSAGARVLPARAPIPRWTHRGTQSPVRTGHRSAAPTPRSAAHRPATCAPAPAPDCATGRRFHRRATRLPARGARRLQPTRVPPLPTAAGVASSASGFRATGRRSNARSAEPMPAASESCGRAAGTGQQPESPATRARRRSPRARRPRSAGECLARRQMCRSGS